MPQASARRTIFSAMRSRPSAVSGIPPSSSVSATITPPYFFTNGNTMSMDSCLPLTELIRGLPLYSRMAASMARPSEVSICRGRSVTPCSARTTPVILSVSSISGSPTLTSSTWAPLSCWAIPSRRMYSMSFSRRACLKRALPVGLIRSPTMTGAPPIVTALA